MKDLERFYGRQARFYDVTRKLFLLDRKTAVERLDVRPGHCVIDFGCGTGLNFPYLRSFSPARITGVDLSAAMLERARAKAPDARITRGDIVTVRLPERADRVLCTYALSMVDRWSDALRNMHRHLEPSGTLVILDFHTLSGALRPADRLWRWWFSRFGVYPDRDVATALRGLFGEVEARVSRSGYNVLLRARAPNPPV